MSDGSSNALATAGSRLDSGSAASVGALRQMGQRIRQLSESLVRLESAARPLQLPPLDGREWFDLLQRKLLPQLNDDAYLIVAVVGGTNIGKSVVFNHIAGFRASASSPLASGTKHPVALIPQGFDESHDLSAIFPSFELRPWSSGDEALLDIPAHCMFWRSHDRVPSNLVILDTPDVDSDAPVNWQRADAVRQAADVLVAVLTQQKYNDAAVKQFFRKAAMEDKAAIIVFNQVELPDDEEYWPIWLNTFCRETGLNPEYVYLAPNNRKAAEAIALEFEERIWKPGDAPQLPGASRPGSIAIPNGTTSRVSLASALSQMHFAEIKLRTLRGSLQFVLNPDTGVQAYLNEIQARSRQFHEAAGVFLRRSMVQHADWPVPPNSLLVNEMWAWWSDHREAWTAGVHGFYSRISGVLRNGVQAVRIRLGYVPADAIAEYREREWDAIVRVLQQLYEQLQIITKLNNPLLTERLESLLSGTTCEGLLSRLHADHERFDFHTLVHELVTGEMEWLRTERQPLFELLRKFDGATAVFRPVITIGFALGGGIGAEHFLMDAATQTLTHLAVDSTVAVATTAAGEAAVDATAGLMGQAKASLLRLHQKFKQRREVWLLEQIRHHFLGDLLTDLEAGATISRSATCQDVTRLLNELVNQIKQQETP
ncbi:MAG: 50S ribosome-binding GTPase [Planctomycetes bacterium]|nr:50S ribosome-binding GTPase [Planctomycetota bacterium]